jgi:hypothetical protein
MIGWYPGWQMVLGWLAVTAVAAAIYFGPMTQLILTARDWNRKGSAKRALESYLLQAA